MKAAEVSLRFKGAMFVLFLVAYLVFYVLPNFFPRFEPAFMPMFHVDYATPLMPWTFVIYMSDYIMIPIAVLLVDDRKEFMAFARAAFGVLILSGAVFVFYPTQYPRPIYPEAPNWFIGWLMSIIASLDRPTNCFPSMHVAITGVAAWAMRTKGPRYYLPFGIWALAIFVSTLTTKQHYLLDIAGGLAAVGIMIALEAFVFGRRPVAAVPKRRIKSRNRESNLSKLGSG